ncbi:hypothetical protein OSB04_011449 [Centaurea solstitialis]|uniref:Uncharacterized protein n=1 Tax=Centaurea solstitialis TaxID=347529 RepID=A0AA38WLI4_9ASTR|nr:hypothetical protein OSB04_011449 [Centaurea solstitialis]
MSFLRIWGCEVYVKRPTSEKLKPKSDKCIFVGYPRTTVGYYFYNPEENKVFVARNGKFLEEKFLSSGNTRKDVDLQILDENDTTPTVEPEIQHENVEPQSESIKEVQTRDLRRFSRVRQEPDRYLGFLITQSNGDLNEPVSYGEAVSGNESKQWQEAMKAEMQSMYDNHVWELEDLPQHCKVVEHKWVFKKKTDMDGNVHTYKARLVAKDFTQTHGIDFDETFSPVAMLKSIWILMAISAYFNYEIWQMDVNTAFLNGKLTEDVYMQQPEGFVDPKNPDKVCKLLKSIYGLKQASRSWNLHFDERIKEFGFAKSEFKPCVYTKLSGSTVTFLVLYVDDILLIGNDVPTLQSVKNWLSKCFQMKDLGEAAYILGIKIYRNRSKRLIGLSQSTYIDKILKKFRMDESKKGFIPMQHGIVLSKTQCPVSSQDQDKMRLVSYASAIGSIMYAMLCTSPDVAYSVSVTSRYQQNLGEPHWVAVKNVLKYLRRTKDMFLVFGGSEDEISVTAYSDASFQTDRDDFRSQSGYVFTLNGGAISWKSSKQDTIADSTTEAEYIGASDAAKEAVWLRNFLSDLRVVASVSRPIDIFCDKSGAVAQAKEPREQHKSRHVLRKYHLIREIIGRGDVRICKIPTEENVADPLTKPLARVKNEAHAIHGDLAASLEVVPVAVSSPFVFRSFVCVNCFEVDLTTTTDPNLTPIDAYANFVELMEYTTGNNKNIINMRDVDLCKRKEDETENTKNIHKGVILMRNMETYMGVDDGRWENGLYRDGSKQKKQMKDLRTKYVMKMLNNKENIHNDTIAMKVLSFISMEAALRDRRSSATKFDKDEDQVTADLLESFEEPEREFRKKKNKKKSKANKVHPRALIFEMEDEAPMWTTRRAAPTVPTNPITKPGLNKEIPGKLFHMIKDLTFDGKNDSNPIVHMENFVDICDLFKTEEGRDDAIRLQVFPLTLTGEARAWLRSLEPSSITTWEGLRSKFLSRFFPPSKIDKLRAEIRSFQQDKGETISEAWERFKHLLNSCPSHGLNKSEQVQTFYSGLAYSSRATLDSSAGGVFMYKTPTEGYKLLEDMLIHNIDWRTDKRLQIPRMAGKISTDFDPSDELAAMKNQQVKFERKIEELIKSVHALQVGCEECNGPHLPKDCPNRPMMTPEEVNYINRGDYQGRWNNNRNFIPRPPGFFAPNQQNQRPDGEPRVSIEDRIVQFMDMQKKLNDEGNYQRKHKSTLKSMLMMTGEPSKKKWTDIYTKKYVESDSGSEPDYATDYDSEGFTISFEHLGLKGPVASSDDEEEDGKQGGYAEFMIPKKEDKGKQKEKEKAPEDDLICIAPIKHDLGSYNLPISCHKFKGLALVDSGAALNMMPVGYCRKMGVKKIIPTDYQYRGVNGYMTKPLGIAEGVPIRIGNFVYYTDFVIANLPQNTEIPIILGRSFLHTAQVNTDMQNQVTSLGYGENWIYFDPNGEPVTHLDEPYEDPSLAYKKNMNRPLLPHERGKKTEDYPNPIRQKEQTTNGSGPSKKEYRKKKGSSSRRAKK